MSETATSVLYQAAGHGPLIPGAVACLLCGVEWDGDGAVAKSMAIKDTFTDIAWAARPDAGSLCPACMFCLTDHNVVVAARTGKETAKFRNYSHFVTAGGEWLLLNSAVEHRRTMTRLLTTAPLPCLAVVATSGQKHLVFKAIANPPVAEAGWVQFEEQRIWLQPSALRGTLDLLQPLYDAGFVKDALLRGDYQNPRTIRAYGVDAFQQIEGQLERRRGTALFELAVWLLCKSEEQGGGNEQGNDGASSPNREPEQSGQLVLKL